MSTRVSQRRRVLGRLARWAGRRPWLTMGVALGAVLVSGIVSTGLADVLTNEIRFTHEPESVKAANALEEVRGPEPLLELVAIRSDRHTVDDPEFAAFVAPLVAEIRTLTDHLDLSRTVTYFEYQIPDLVSADRSATLIPVTVLGTIDEADAHVAALEDALDAYDNNSGFDVVTAGQASVNMDFTDLSERDLSTETKVLPFALLVLVIVFGAVVAALVPLVLAFFAIALALTAATVIGQFFDLSIFVTNMTFGIGLAVGIDYSLFIVARFREQRASGYDRLDAIEASANTATRAVTFSGITVVIALLGMFIVPTSIFRSLATGAILAVLSSVLISLVVLPALLSLLGDKVDLLSVPRLGARARRRHPERSFWTRTARAVMRRPVVTVVASAGFLIALAIPYLDLQLGAAGAESLPENTDSARANAILAEDFEVGRVSPVEMVVKTDDAADPGVSEAVDGLASSMAEYPVFGTPEPTAIDASTVLLSVPLSADYASDEAQSAVDLLRDDLVPAAFAGVDAEVYVGGQPAFVHDWFATVDRYTPIVFAFVLGFSFLLLLVAFRSVVVPLKAILMNLLSVGAAYGLLVLVFQHGVGAGVLGFQQVEAIEAWVPLFLFTVLFGLSMDYHVFLLSRIKEHYDETGDNVESVAFGLRTTGGIITGAAAIMVVVFGGFALGDLVMFQQMGFGLAVAVFLDATIVRSLLVPATMRLLGARNWFFPRWLRWVPRIEIEAISTAAPTQEREPA